MLLKDNWQQQVIRDKHPIMQEKVNIMPRQIIRVDGEHKS
jgi:hypothetical protein